MGAGALVAAGGGAFLLWNRGEKDEAQQRFDDYAGLGGELAQRAAPTTPARPSSRSWRTISTTSNGATCSGGWGSVSGWRGSPQGRCSSRSGTILHATRPRPRAISSVHCHSRWARQRFDSEEGSDHDQALIVEAGSSGFVALRPRAPPRVGLQRQHGREDQGRRARAGVLDQLGLSRPLLCAFERCHVACNEDRDCPDELRCVLGSGDGVNVCQLPDEVDCDGDKDCAGDQVCGVDEECRDQCDRDGDCVDGQICAASEGARARCRRRIVSTRTAISCPTATGAAEVKAQARRRNRRQRWERERGRGRHDELERRRWKRWAERRRGW